MKVPEIGVIYEDSYIVCTFCLMLEYEVNSICLC